MKAVKHSLSTAPGTPGPRLGRRSTRAAALVACLVLGLGGLVGCQTSVGGQTLPSAYYLQDDIQFFPAGPEFKLANQAAAMQQARLRQLGAQP